MNRNVADLKPNLQLAWLRMELIMQILGNPIFLVEGLRTEERQDYLFESGISPVQNSQHEEGAAIDVAFRGALPYSDGHPWKLLGMIGEALGLTWGGRWKSVDSTHFQL
jgi:peptidoglycan L-alanyl-D-glutamate endopeptidase CwlK